MLVGDTWKTKGKSTILGNLRHPLLDIVEVGMCRTLARAEQFLRRRLRVIQALVGHHLLNLQF